MSQPSLLVIDDDPSIRLVLDRFLGGAGFSVHQAPDGRAGLAATETHRPEVVLCDWVMPELDGIEYCRRIKSDPQLKSTFVTVLTSRDGIQDKVTALDAGADGFLTKPIRPDEVLASVRAALRIRELQRELADARHKAALVELAAMLGHEINNPLTALFGHLELLLQHIEAGDQANMMHHVRRAADVSGRIAEVAKRLTSLTEPRTTTYLGSVKMLDLSEGDDPV